MDQQEIQIDSLRAEILNKLNSMSYKKIVILVGAGISVAAGIPDFRSPQTGYFDTFTNYNVPYPEAMFEREYFKENPLPLFKFIWGIIKMNPRPTNAHYFMKLLGRKNIISKIFTQNIDGLEKIARIKSKLVVNAHGTLRDFICKKCQLETSIEDHMSSMEQIIHCECGAVVRPNLLFYDEKLPQKYWKNLDKISEADLIMIMGTSLQVSPFDKVINLINPETPIIVFNKEKFQLQHPKVLNITGDIQKTSLKVIDELGWRLEFDKLKGKKKSK